MKPNRMGRDAVNELQRAVSDAAVGRGLELDLIRSTGDGYGGTGTPILTVASRTRSEPIVLWHEHGNDFWIEFGEGVT